MPSHLSPWLFFLPTPTSLKLEFYGLPSGFTKLIRENSTVDSTLWHSSLPISGKLYSWYCVNLESWAFLFYQLKKWFRWFYDWWFCTKFRTSMPSLSRTAISIMAVHFVVHSGVEVHYAVSQVHFSSSLGNRQSCCSQCALVSNVSVWTSEQIFATFLVCKMPCEQFLTA